MKLKDSNSSYYITCLMSGAIELGAVFLGMKMGYSLLGIIGLALAYQLGNVFRFFVTKKISTYQNHIALLATILSAFVLAIHNMDLIVYLCICLTLLLYSTVLQNVRSAVQGNIPRWKKRSCRVLGFVLSALMYVYGPVLLLIFCVILLIYSVSLDHFYYDNWLENWISGKYGERVCWSMVTHQAHYFAYNYIMLVLVMRYFNNPFIASLWFAANWIPYTITEPLIQKLKWDKWYAIALGAHIFNAIVLTGMYIYVDFSITTALLLWVSTGFGGGNVFCIKKALSSKIKYDKDVWSFSEQLGHILGVLSALVVALVGIPEKDAMLVAVAFALVTVPIIAERYRRKL